MRDDCGTLRGLEITPLKKDDIIVEKLSDRIEGRVALHDIYVPNSDEIIVEAGALITTHLREGN